VNQQNQAGARDETTKGKRGHERGDKGKGVQREFRIESNKFKPQRPSMAVTPQNNPIQHGGVPDEKK